MDWHHLPVSNVLRRNYGQFRENHEGNHNSISEVKPATSNKNCTHLKTIRQTSTTETGALQLKSNRKIGCASAVALTAHEINPNQYF